MAASPRMILQSQRVVRNLAAIRASSRTRTTALLCACLLLGCAAAGEGAPRRIISSYTNASIPVLHAIHRLSDYTAIPVESDAKEGHVIRIERNATPNPRIGTQGYTILSSDRGDITIRGNDEEGTANGIYTFLRTLMIERRKDPFSRAWNIEEKPQFPIRAMLVSPYRFGGSYGFAVLSPDRWPLEEWKAYVDFMRLCNMTTLTLGSERVYNPDYPRSARDQWRYEVWKQVMEYCHQVGMKFDWFISPNLVTEQAFWDNPDKRAFQEPGTWYGNGLSWRKAKDLILQNQKYTLEYFRGLDALEIIYSDGGGFDFNDPDPAKYFADATQSYMQLMKDVGNDAGFVFWNWVLDFWSKVAIPEEILEKYPKYRTLQDDVVPLIPRNVTWLDASILTLAQIHWSLIQGRGNPPLRESVLIGKEAGFRPVIDFFWYMNPEFALNMFSHPYIRRTIQEAQYARDELGVDGVMGYRLAPPCRFIDDYVYFRLASDPSLTQEQLVSELAGLLAEKPEDQVRVKEAVNTLERFWTTHNLGDLESAEKLFREALPQEKSRNLEYVSNGVTFLTYVVRMAQPGVTAEEKTRLKAELYRAAKPMYIFQGLTADVVWIPEAVRFLNARLDMMVEEYKSPIYGGSPYPELVDRALYPHATSKPFKLRWPSPKSDMRK